MKKGRKFTLKRILAGLLVMAMVCGYLPAGLRGSHIAKAEETVFGKVSDPDTHDRAQDIFAGTTLNAGRVMVGKFVNENKLDFSTEAEGASWLVSDPENFLIAISQASQAMGVSSEIPVPIDAVFVLDTSGSMKYDIDSSATNVQKEDQRATHMVAAANDAIESLLAANPLNRVGVVAFSDGTTVLSELNTYTGTAATNHLQWVDSNGNVGDDESYIAGRNENGGVGGRRHGTDGGTNIHAGIAAGAQLLTGADDTTVTIGGKEVSRIPFLIVLSDGAPTFSGSSTDWTVPTGTQGPGSSSYVGNGFLPVLTAAYYKEAIGEHYFGEGNVTESNRAYMYTIGVGVDGLSDDDEALASITLNPKDHFVSTSTNKYYNGNDGENFASYWQSYLAGTADFEIIVDEEWEYVGNQGSGNNQGPGGNWGPGGNQGPGNSDNNWELQDVTYTITKEMITKTAVTALTYNDNYYPANNASGLDTAFRNIVVEIQKRAITYPTLTDVEMTADYSGYVTFRDVIGEYMEVKDMKGVIADGQLFRGEVFAKFMNMKQTEVDGDTDAQAFMNALIHSMEVRFGLRLPGETDATHGSMEAFLNDAWNWAHDRDENGQVYADGTKNPDTQMYYYDSENFDNSICWWGHTSNDGAVQLLGWAADDSIEYIEAAKEMAANGEAYRKGVGSAVAEGADYVARSYFFYGSADGATTYDKAYLDFSVTVMRDLKAPYTQTVVISAPASLLAMQRVLIYDTDKDGKITAYFDEVVPTRVIYEVGLRDDVTAESAESVLSEEYKKANKVDGGYIFYTNEWLRNPADGEAKALTYATFSSALRNDYYVFEKNTPVYVKNGDSYVKYTGTEQPSGRGYYYAHEYYTWDADATAEQGAAGVDCSGVKVEYLEMEIPTPANTTQVKWDSAQGCWVILAGTFKAQSLVESGIEEKTENKTGTGDHIAHPIRTGGETDPHYTVYLGNNGKLTFATAEAKSVFNANGDDIDGLTAMVGEELTYQVRVSNTKDAPADATIVDTIPLGTELVEDSVKVYKDDVVQTGGYSFSQNASTLTWGFTAIPVGSEYVAEFKVKVTEMAMDQSTVSNQATVTIGENTYKTNLVSNPIEGKKATGATSTVIPADGVQVGDQIIYTIQYYNDTNATADVKIVDAIPAGTAYVVGSATNGGTLTNGALTWTIKNVATGTGGSVSFKVEVTAAALTVNPFTNTATIQIGNNAPTQSTNEVEIDVKIGDLVLSKEVTTDGVDAGLNPNANQKFVLVLTETSGKLKDAAEEFALVDASGNAIKDPDNNNNEVKVKFDANSQAKVTIKAGQTVVVKGLPVGVTIVVTEEPVAGYTPSYAPRNSATIVENDAQTPAVSVTVTNTYAPNPYNASARFNFTKTFVNNGNATLTNKKFDFVAHPADENGNLTHDRAAVVYGTVTVNGGAQKAAISFNALNIGKTGTYYYLVTESVGTSGGIYYDPTEFLIKFTIVDDGSGQLKLQENSVELKARANVDQDWTAAADWDFENVYTPEPTRVGLEAKKVLKDKNSVVINDLSTHVFTFEVVKDGNVVAVVANDKDGNVKFPAMPLSSAGEYKFTICEVNEGHVGYSYDENIYTATVVVKDNGAGQLVVESVKYSLGNSEISGLPTFNNAFDDSVESGASALIKATKVLTNREKAPLKAGEFYFVLKNVATNRQIFASNDANGNILFNVDYSLKDLEGLADGASKEFNYKLSEVKGNIGGVDYSTERFNVKVNVKKNSGTNPYDVEVTYFDANDANNTQINGVTFTNTYRAEETSLRLAVKKVLTGRDLNLDEFRFEMKDTATDKVVSIGYNDASGNVLFNAIKYTKAGTYTYKVYEVEGDLGGIKYDGEEYIVVISVTDNNEGQLVASIKSITNKGGTDVTSEGITFNNTYKPTGTSITLGTEGTVDISKVLTGRPLKGGEFTFVLTGDGITGEKTAENNADGKIVFPEIDYTAAGEYTYTISEKEGNLGGITYSGKSYKVKVKVTDNLKGNLVAEVINVVEVKETGDTAVNQIEFVNTYKTNDAQITFKGDKVVVGHYFDIAAGKFNFVVKDLAGNVITKAAGSNVAAVNKAQIAEIVFGTITYTFEDYLASDTYTYIISEAESNIPGMTDDKSEFIVTVKLTDDGKGTLTATATYPNTEGKVTFTNTYKPTATSIVLQANKKLEVEGGDLELTKDKFSFYVAEKLSNGEYLVLENKGNEASGLVEFSAIELTKAGTYEYAIGENVGHDGVGGMTYDHDIYLITVEVVDKNGQLEAEITKVQLYDGKNAVDLKVDDAREFVNLYTAKATEAVIHASKELAGKDLEEKEFRFLLEDEKGNKLYAYNGADGKITFKKEFTAVGTYKFTLSEAPESVLDCITYDTNKYEVTVEVVDDKHGQLHAHVSYGADKATVAPVFKNTYTPNAASVVLEALKELVGRDLKDGEFTFEVKDETGKVVATGKNDADGKIVFDEIELVAGEYNYTISEVIGEAEDTIYDKNVYKVKVEIADTDNDGVLESKITYPEGGVKFINEHYEGVDTGDNSQMILWGAIAALCVVAVGVLLVIRKKFNK